MCDKCYSCPDVKYKQCPAPRVLTGGKLCCELGQNKSSAVCSQCGNPLIIGHFAYNYAWKEFWCEACLRELLESEVPNENL